MDGRGRFARPAKAGLAIVTDPKRAAAVPTGRTSRLFQLSGVAAGNAGAVVAGGLRQLTAGNRPGLPDLLLTPSSALRLTEGLSHMRGAALKLGQMLSMDTGLPVTATDFYPCQPE